MQGNFLGSTNNKSARLKNPLASCGLRTNLLFVLFIQHKLRQTATLLRVQQKNSQIPIIMTSRLSSENYTLNLENQDAVAQWRARYNTGLII